MLAPTFDILEDVDMMSDATVGGGRIHSAKSGQGKKQALGLRAGTGPNRSSNVQPMSGPVKPSAGASSASSSKPAKTARAFGAVLATPNTANSSTQHKSAGKSKGGSAATATTTFAKAAPTPVMAARPALAPRDKNVTDIEICYKGSAKHPIDEETAELMQTNKNAEKMYRSICAAAMLGAPPPARPASSYTAPLDDDAAFGIFEDGDSDVNALRAANAAAAADDGLIDVEGESLW